MKFFFTLTHKHYKYIPENELKLIEIISEKLLKIFGIIFKIISPSRYKLI